MAQRLRLRALTTGWLLRRVRGKALTAGMFQTMPGGDPVQKQDKYERPDINANIFLWEGAALYFGVNFQHMSQTLSPLERVFLRA